MKQTPRPILLDYKPQSTSAVDYNLPNIKKYSKPDVVITYLAPDKFIEEYPALGPYWLTESPVIQQVEASKINVGRYSHYFPGLPILYDLGIILYYPELMGIVQDDLIAAYPIRPMPHKLLKEYFLICKSLRFDNLYSTVVNTLLGELSSLVDATRDHDSYNLTRVRFFLDTDLYLDYRVMELAEHVYHISTASVIEGMLELLMKGLLNVSDDIVLNFLKLYPNDNPCRSSLKSDDLSMHTGIILNNTAYICDLNPAHSERYLSLIRGQLFKEPYPVKIGLFNLANYPNPDYIRVSPVDSLELIQYPSIHGDTYRMAEVYYPAGLDGPNQLIKDYGKVILKSDLFNRIVVQWWINKPKVYVEIFVDSTSNPVTYYV